MKSYEETVTKYRDTFDLIIFKYRRHYQNTEEKMTHPCRTIIKTLHSGQSVRILEDKICIIKGLLWPIMTPNVEFHITNGIIRSRTFVQVIFHLCRTIIKDLTQCSVYKNF